MKLAVPFFGELDGPDARLVRLAEFLGVSCETVALKRTAGPAEFLRRSTPGECSCIVVNPRVFKEWVGRENLSAELVNLLLSRFTHLVIHGLRVDAFDSALVAALSRGSVNCIEAINGQNHKYGIAKDSRDICEAFAGISFGPANRNNDHVLSLSSSDQAVRQLISIGCRPFMCAIKGEGAELLLVASEDVADVNAAVGRAPLVDYFSRFLPQAMALRYVAGDECWRPGGAFGTIIIDDPLLRKNYGFLSFEALLRLANHHNFHATIAFIPHNYRRNSSQITRLFQENPERLSICFHGNDHTQGEFASIDQVLLNTLLFVAEDRMKLHEGVTGLHCDDVMAFPQGSFSLEAMRVLKSHNFSAAVNSIPYPAQEEIKLTLGELAQPAVLRYEGFPLFLRECISGTQDQDVAFKLFFGRPALIVEHHELFEHPEPLVEIAARINSMAPEMHWSRLAIVAANSILTRRSPGGVQQVRAFSCKARISNESSCIGHYLIEWGIPCGTSLVEHVLVDGAPCRDFEIGDGALRLSVEIIPGCSREVSLVYRNDLVVAKNLGPRWVARAFVRRRLSEFRDNYLTKNQGLLEAAKAMQRRFLRI